MIKTTVSMLLTSCFLAAAFNFPLDNDMSIVVTTPIMTPATPPGCITQTPTTPKYGKLKYNRIELYQMHVKSKVANRYAFTNVLSKVRNAAKESQEVIFAIVLPETAFISGFIMEIDGKNYTAYVKEKEEAKKTYDQAVSSGIGAAHVAVSARDSNRFTVSVNIEPQGKAAFYLIYEELLKRQDGHYELVLNLHPGQPVKDLLVEVVIAETRKILDVKAPPLRSGNEISQDKLELLPEANIKIRDDKNAVVTFSPTLERQKRLAGALGTKEEDGLAGQFVVQYDVERDPSGGEVLIQDGYFVHFFAPTELKPLPKYVVFILDTSSSMHGSKIAQLREAMLKILEQLHEQDIFSLVEFNSNVKVWNLNENKKSVWWPSGGSFRRDPGDNDESLFILEFPPAYQANADNIKLAKTAVSTLTPTAATNIFSALKVGLHLVELVKSMPNEENHQPLIIFLTDGEPTVGVTSTSVITSKVTDYNSGVRKSVIFTLSFGDSADKTFLQKIATRNLGFSRHIYEAADASIQLQNFYKQISSPLLSNVTFTYEPSVVSLTTTEFPVHYGGAEIVVAGFCDADDLIPPYVVGMSEHGFIKLNTVVQRVVTSIERLWAYLTVKQLLDKSELADASEQDKLKKKALDVVLKYEFVTPVSSLVVVKPNASSAVDTEAAEKGYNADSYYNRLGSGSSGFAPATVGLNYFTGPANSDLVDIRIEETSDTYVPSLTTPPSQPPTITSRPTSTTIPTRPSIFDLFEALPWLRNSLKDGQLNLSKGNYLLGSNETITDIFECITPYGKPGHCQLLHTCKQIHSTLITKEKYEDYFCALEKKYAGVCCPDIDI